MEEKQTWIGTQAGEVCNRDGCTGIIKAYEKEGSCNCMNNPPCSYCMEQTEYCPKCGWDVNEDE